MHSIICTIKEVDYELKYSSEVKENYVEFRGTLFINPPFDFKYIILHHTKSATQFEPNDLDEIVCDRITHVILNNEKNIQV